MQRLVKLTDDQLDSVLWDIFKTMKIGYPTLTHQKWFQFITSDEEVWQQEIGPPLIKLGLHENAKLLGLELNRRESSLPLKWIGDHLYSPKGLKTDYCGGSIIRRSANGTMVSINQLVRLILLQQNVT